MSNVLKMCEADTLFMIECVEGRKEGNLYLANYTEISGIYNTIISAWETTLKAMPHVTISSTISSTFHRRRWLLTLQR